MFTGAHRVRVDDKGRLAIPAGFRKQLPEGSYVSVSQDSALAIYPPDLWDALAQELRSPLPGPDQRALARTLYSMSEAFEPDGQGRITLGMEQRRLTGIETPSKDVVIGMGSSVQLDAPERGFSVRADGPLDMRMDTDSTLDAARIVNTFDPREIERILRDYGEERWARRIAQFIVARRPLRTTRDLASAVEAAIPRRAWPRDINVATRTFQGIRIAVNDELGEIEAGLKAALGILKPGGRMATISFHSLEDRLVKSFFNVESKDCICPPQQPVCTCGHRASLRIVTRHPVRPSEEEVAANPRARSARLRVAEKI